MGSQSDLIIEVSRTTVRSLFVFWDKRVKVDPFFDQTNFFNLDAEMEPGKYRVMFWDPRASVNTVAYREYLRANGYQSVMSAFLACVGTVTMLGYYALIPDDKDPLCRYVSSARSVYCNCPQEGGRALYLTGVSINRPAYWYYPIFQQIE